MKIIDIKKITKNSISFNVAIGIAPDDLNFWNLVIANLWEPITFHIFSRFLRRNCSYIDIGAWIGPTVLYGSQLCRCCYAIEPDPVAFEALKTNINLNPGILNVELFKGAIGITNGKTSMGVYNQMGESISGFMFTKDSFEVESITLESFFEKYKIIDCNFIKMDIEGGEYIVLPASKRFLETIKPTLYLSLHPFFAPNSFEDTNAITEILEIYRHIYDLSGREIRNLHGVHEVIATDEDL
jgi:FkbM family methyltransferase